MGKIVILDEKTANQIAAGEVIERPSSVVKEMAENAIDAGATQITVEIRNGGIAYIRVADNGSGMESDDAELAFERHATSKIRKIEDLDGLRTMGFRGEALASIASVSHLEVVTKTEDAPTGTFLKIEGGRVKSVSQVGCPKGTTFIVRNLFYNTPARYKFLKKDTTEAGYVSDILERLALAHPEISFKFIQNNQVQLHTPGNNDLLSVIYSVYGKEVSKSVLPVRYEGEGLLVGGFIGKPEISRGTRNQQSIFINGRYIKSRIIAGALEEAYKTLLMQNKFPFCVLRIEASPESFDVNVHPQKLEVRFSNESLVYSAVYHSVKNALMGASLIRSFDSAPRGQRYEKQADHEARKQAAVSITELALETPCRDSQNTESPTNASLFESIERDAKASAMEGAKTPGEVPPPAQEALHNQELINEIRPEHKNSGYKNPLIRPMSPMPDEAYEQSPPSFGKAKVSEPHIKQEEPYAPQPSVSGSLLKPILAEQPVQETESQDGEQLQIERNEALSGILDAEIVGQAFETYILLQKGDTLYIIDQHAAHERIRYETLKKRFENRDAFSQAVLEPYIIRLSAAEADFVNEKRATFERLGFELEEFGPNTIILRSIPDIYDTSFSTQDFQEILDRWMKTSARESSISDEALFLMSCKGALKANRALPKEEIRGLVESLCGMENPFTCVHGRPVIIEMSKREFEKRFKRIV